MGAGIVVLCANAGFPVLFLDMLADLLITQHINLLEQEEQDTQNLLLYITILKK